MRIQGLVMKYLVSLLLVSTWLLSWSAPLLSAPCAMGCCKTKGLQKSTLSISFECRSHCGEDGCCSWQESEASESAIQPMLLSLKYEDQKSPLYKTDPVVPSKEGRSKDRGAHLLRNSTLLSNCLIPLYLQNKHLLI